jgi:hypothetical protein
MAPQLRSNLLPLLARLRLQGIGPASDLRQGSLDVSLIEDSRQVRCVRPHQHGSLSRAAYPLGMVSDT